ncbi:unnamed protein product [Trichobilharzia regenti]|nr:unnamed protein product [Trichobilharzia regenti]
MATAIAFLDICFILACVPESLPEKVRIGHLCSVSTLGGPSGKFSWGKADPFAVLYIAIIREAIRAGTNVPAGYRIPETLMVLQLD